VFAFHDAFEPDVPKVDELKAHYRHGGLGDSVVKRVLNERLQSLLEPIRERRRELECDRAEVLQILRRRSSGHRWGRLARRPFRMTPLRFITACCQSRRRVERETPATKKHSALCGPSGSCVRN
jgi:hypothetical protein